MIDLVENNITQGNNTEQIERWEVWFITPFGLTPDCQQAVQRLQSVDLDPRTCMKAIPVAMGETLWEPAM